MEKKEISREQVKVIGTFVSRSGDWLSSSDVVRHSEVVGSTVRHLVLDFHRLGLLERFESFPGYRYRLSLKATEHPYLEKLQQAAEIMGETNWLVVTKTE
jgi:DNA-binding IclR family transcriptional regulator